MPEHVKPQTSETELSLLKEVFELAPSFMAVLSGANHVFELANMPYYQLVGQRDILGKPVGVALPEVAQQGFVDLLDEVYQTGNPFVGKEVEVLLQMTPDAPLSKRYLDFVYQPRRNASGEIEGIFVHGVDVTDLVISRQDSEARALELKTQAQTLNTLVSSISDFVYVFDRDGRFTFANKPLLDLLGITLEEIVGKNFHELPYPEDLATTLQAYIQQVVDTRRQIVDETPYVNPEGVSGYYEYIFTPVFGEDGEVLVVSGSTRNITERKEQERQKDDFLAIVSHELRTPITSLKAHIQILQRQFTKDGETRAVSSLKQVNAQINKLTALINDLLDVNVIAQGHMRFSRSAVPFDEVVSEAVSEVQRTTSQHTIVQKGSANRTIVGDRDRIGQVIINLLVNAAKYSPDAEKIIVTTTSSEHTVSVSVQDFGQGISTDALPHIFERFFRASEERQTTVRGLGIGLYVSAEIIRRHGGTIGVESTPGKGSIFHFALPVEGGEDIEAIVESVPLKRLQRQP